MIKKIGLVLLLLIVFTGIVSAQDNSTDCTVLNDDEEEYISIETLQDEIDSADEKGTVEVNGSYASFNDNNYININKSITLKGLEGNEINGNNYLKISINKGDVTLENLNFRDGHDSYLIINNANLTMINCTFNNVRKTIQNNGNLRIIDSQFSDYYDFNCQGETEIINSTFKSKDAASLNFNGDSIKLNDSRFINATLYINSTEISIFKSRFYAPPYGSIRVSNDMIMEGCEFNDYRMVFDKLNVYSLHNSIFNGCSNEMKANTVKYYNCTLNNHRISNSDNENLKLELYDCNVNRTNINSNSPVFKNTVFNNISYFRFENGAVIDNCSFINNHDDTNFLNAFNCGDNLVQITNCRFINNTCKDYLIYLDLNVKNINISSNVFANNSCDRLLFYTIYLLYNSNTDKWTKTLVYFDFSENILLNNFNKDKEYAQALIFIDSEYIFDPPKITPAVLTVENNFLGFNRYYGLEKNLLMIIDAGYHPNEWANLEMSKSNDIFSLKFQNANGQSVALPDTTVHVKDKKTGEMLLSNIPVKNGQGTFKLNKSIDEVYLINEAGGIINKPKANLTLTVTGNSYDNIKVSVKLQNGTMPLANQTFSFEIIGYTEQANPYIYIYKTDSSGNLVLHERNRNQEDQQSSVLDDGIYSKFDLIVTFSSMEYGFTQVKYENLKLNKIPVALSVKTTPNTYTKANLKLTSSKPCDIEIRIYENNRLIDEDYMYLNKGDNNYRLNNLDAGTYKIVIKAPAYEHHVLSTTVTVKINPLKLKVTAKKVTNKYKKSKYYKFTVKNGKKISVKLKIGKKTYKVKTDKKGVVKFNTKKLKIGKYQVTITSNDGNYKFSAKSKLTIKR